MAYLFQKWSWFVFGGGFLKIAHCVKPGSQIDARITYESDGDLMRPALASTKAPTPAPCENCSGTVFFNGILAVALMTTLLLLK